MAKIEDHPLRVESSGLDDKPEIRRGMMLGGYRSCRRQPESETSGSRRRLPVRQLRVVPTAAFLRR
jgi:hypothetical protein